MAGLSGSGGRGAGAAGGAAAAVPCRAAPGPLADAPALRNDARAGELMAALVWWLAACCLARAASAGNPDAKRLYDDLLSNYNKLVRPVVNTTDVLRVCIKLKLSQLIDVVSVARPGARACAVWTETDLHRMHTGCSANLYLGCTCAPHLEFK